jgi:hypothetical protein
LSPPTSAGKKIRKVIEVKEKARVSLKCALTALLLAVFALSFAGEALAASLGAQVTKYETFKAKNGIWQVRVFIEVTNNLDDDRVITNIYDLSFQTTADIKSVTSGKVYKMTRKAAYPTVKPVKLDLWPGQSHTFKFELAYNNFTGKGWKWEGEEKTGKPPLTKFKTSNITMKYKTRRP